ncbi:hypothetical protein GTS_55580 [Gandjariella thermophila]|uniref:Uncharacterized protein n=1 Tax=Gandjariella thermophila TaxID=1931992 RepID=A0A4D4JAS7_9PSEU|nr:hypothetical protein [Gandjariella thermophila]GDY33925.1 hypothetical protein GTS_55580 [Gandjariella thermophila]
MARAQADQDELSVSRPASRLEIVTPRPQLRAIAATLGACPQPRAEVEAAGQASLDRNQQHFAAHHVDVLLEMGWLEAEDSELHAVHDIVIDQVLEQVRAGEAGHLAGLGHEHRRQGRADAGNDLDGVVARVACELAGDEMGGHVDFGGQRVEQPAELLTRAR